MTLITVSTTVLYCDGGWNSSFLRDFDQTAVICVRIWIKFPNFAHIGPSAAK